MQSPGYKIIFHPEVFVCGVCSVEAWKESGGRGVQSFHSSLKWHLFSQTPELMIQIMPPENSEAPSPSTPSFMHLSFVQRLPNQMVIVTLNYSLNSIKITTPSGHHASHLSIIRHQILYAWSSVCPPSCLTLLHSLSHPRWLWNIKDSHTIDLLMFIQLTWSWSSQFSVFFFLTMVKYYIHKIHHFSVSTLVCCAANHTICLQNCVLFPNSALIKHPPPISSSLQPLEPSFYLPGLSLL